METVLGKMSRRGENAVLKEKEQGYLEVENSRKRSGDAMGQ